MRNAFGEDFDGARAGAASAGGQASPRPCDPVASAGFGSPGTDFTVKRIDFNDALIRHPQATFVMRMAGDAMLDAGICDGDVLVVDRAIGAQPGHVVIARLDGELVCRRLVKADAGAALESANAGRARMLCSDARPLEVWGVVTFVIHALRV